MNVSAETKTRSNGLSDEMMTTSEAGVCLLMRVAERGVLPASVEILVAASTASRSVTLPPSATAAPRCDVALLLLATADVISYACNPRHLPPFVIPLNTGCC